MKTKKYDIYIYKYTPDNFILKYNVNKKNVKIISYRSVLTFVYNFWNRNWRKKKINWRMGD